MTRECKDCKSERLARGVPVPARAPRAIAKNSGGRCATHWRDEKGRRKKAAHERRVQQVYGLPPGVYDRLYEFQGGKCYICRRATGERKRLAVDHDHSTGLVYGLLCGPCNRDVLGHSRRDVAYFMRCIQYLRNPPARQLGVVAYHKENRETDG